MEDEAARLQRTIDRISWELAQEKALHRRTFEELQWAWEKCRVLQRVIERFGRDNPVE